jgi:hypothetical protein
MYMIDMTFHCQDLDIVFCADIPNEFFKSVFDTRDKKDLSPSVRAENKVISDEGNCRSSASVNVFIHTYIISQIGISVNTGEQSNLCLLH